VAAILEAAADRPLDGVLVVGDRPTVIAARVAEALGLPWHPPAAAAIARHKQRTRERLRDAGLPTPWFMTMPVSDQSSTTSQSPIPNPQSPIPDPQSPIPNPQSPFFPCVVKPVALSGSPASCAPTPPASSQRRSTGCAR